MYAADKRKR